MRRMLVLLTGLILATSAQADDMARTERIEMCTTFSALETICGDYKTVTQEVFDRECWGLGDDIYRATMARVAAVGKQIGPLGSTRNRRGCWSLKRRVVRKYLSNITQKEGDTYGPYLFKIGKSATAWYSATFNIKGTNNFIRHCVMPVYDVAESSDCGTTKITASHLNGGYLRLTGGQEMYHLHLKTGALRVSDRDGILFDKLKPGEVSWIDMAQPRKRRPRRKVR